LNLDESTSALKIEAPMVPLAYNKKILVQSDGNVLSGLPTPIIITFLIGAMMLGSLSKEYSSITLDDLFVWLKSMSVLLLLY